METEKNNITSDNAAEEEVVFNTGKSTKSAPAKQEPEKSAAVSFGTTGKAEKAEKIEKTGKAEKTEKAGTDEQTAKSEPAVENAGVVRQPAGDISFGAKAASSDDGVVFADNTRTETKRKSVRQMKRKSPLLSIPVIIVSLLVICVAVSGIVFAVSYNNNTVPAMVKTESAVFVPETDTNVSSQAEDATALPVIRTDEAQIKTINTETIIFGDSVTVSGVNVSGKTLSEAYEAMQDTLLTLRDNINIEISCDGKTIKLTQDDFRFDNDLPDVLIQAYHYSRGELDSPTVEMTPTNDGRKDFSVRSVINEDSIEDAVKKVAETFDVQPVDAHVVKFEPTKTEKFTYADGSDGYLIDQSEVRTNIRDILLKADKTGAFGISSKKTRFKKSLADIKANTKLIASHCTTAANVWASNFNMELAIKSANGTIVNPGETFSFNGMTGDTTNGSLGYVPSTAIVNGRYEQQYGGGICQASTTIFLAALKADMEVVERHAHQFASAYADRGLDATVDYGNLDMRFKNNYDYPIYIATYVYDYYKNGMDEIMVEIYGPLSTEYDEIVPVGWVTWAGSSSYSARGGKIYFKDGKEIKREYLPSGTYDYHYDSYSYAVSLMPEDPEYGPKDVTPTKNPPTIFSPDGCGSNAPVPYGTAAEYLLQGGTGSSEESVASVSKIDE